MNKLMKKLLLLIIASLTAAGAYCQEEDRKEWVLPIVDDKVTFSQIVKCGEKPADLLYSGIKMSLAEIFKSAKDVIQLDDKENRTIIAKGINQSDDKSSHFEFTLRLTARDGRYRIDLTNFVFVKHSSVIGNVRFGETSNAAENLTDDLCFNAKGELRKMGAGLQRRFLIETKDQIFYEIASRTLKFTNGLTSQSDDTW